MHTHKKHNDLVFIFTYMSYHLHVCIKERDLREPTYDRLPYINLNRLKHRNTSFIT